LQPGQPGRGADVDSTARHFAWLFRIIAAAGLVLCLSILTLHAAVEKTTVTGQILLPGGTPATAGNIVAILSSPGTAMDGASATVVLGRVQASIDPNGRPVGLALVPNDVITPSGTYYQVRITVTAPTQNSWERKWSVTTSPDPVDIGAITVLDTPPSLTYTLDNASDVTLSTPADQDCIRYDLATHAWRNYASASAQCASGGGPAEKLTSVTTTPGDTITFTSDGTNAILTPSRSGSDWIFKDQAAVTLARLYDSTASPRGLNVGGHLMIGQVGAPSAVAALYVDAKVSNGYFAGGTAGAFYKLTLDDVPTGGVDGAITQVEFSGIGANELDSQPPVAGHWFRIEGDTTATVLASAPSESVVLDVKHDVRLNAASAPWNNVIGMRIGTLGTSGVTPLSTWGIQILQDGGGGTYNAGIGVSVGNANAVHISGQGKLGFGQNAGVNPINYMRSLTNTGTTVVMTLNSADEFKWSPTSFFPSTNGGAGLGQNANGFADAWFLDTSAAFEHRVVFTDSSVSSADRVLTVDMKNANQTLSGTNTGDVAAGRSLTLSAGNYDADAELYTRTKCINVDPNSTVTDFLFFRTDNAITVTGIDCLVDSATSLVLTLKECNINGGSCTATEAAMTCGTTNTTEASGIDDAAVAAGAYMRVVMGAKTGTPTQGILCMTYTVDD